MDGPQSYTTGSVRRTPELLAGLVSHGTRRVYMYLHRVLIQGFGEDRDDAILALTAFSPQERWFRVLAYTDTRGMPLGGACAERVVAAPLLYSELCEGAVRLAEISKSTKRAEACGMTAHVTKAILPLG